MIVKTFANTEVEINEQNANFVMSEITDPILIPYLDNPYVGSIHGERIFYKNEFYIAMYKLVHDQGKDAVEAYEELGFKVSDLGENRAHQARKNALEKAKANKLFSVDPASYDGSVPLSAMPNLTTEEENAMLKARVIYLEAINEVQKKIPFILAENCTSSRRTARR